MVRKLNFKKIGLLGLLCICYFTLRAQLPLPGGGSGGGGGGGGGNTCFSPGCIALPESGTADTATAGYSVIRSDATLHEPEISLNGGGFQRLPWSLGNIIASTASITTTETIIKQITIKAGVISAGTAYRLWARGICTSSAANAVTLRLRFGTVGDVTDTIVLSQAVTAATTGSTVPWKWDADLLFRSTVQSHASSTLTNNGVTGISSTQTPLFGGPTTTSSLVTSVANFLSITMVTAVNTTSCSSGSADITLGHY